MYAIHTFVRKNYFRRIIPFAEVPLRMVSLHRYYFLHARLFCLMQNIAISVTQLPNDISV